MKRFLAALLCFFVPVFAWASSSVDNGYKVMYDGGSVQNIKAGSSAKLIIDPTQVRLHVGKDDLVTIPAASITEISYGQDVHRRVGAAIGLGMSREIWAPARDANRSVGSEAKEIAIAREIKLQMAHNGLFKKPCI